MIAGHFEQQYQPRFTSKFEIVSFHEQTPLRLETLGFSLNVFAFNAENFRVFLGRLCKSPAGVIPAKAGIQSDVDLSRHLKSWIPAFAGMTDFCRASLDALARNLVSTFG